MVLQVGGELELGKWVGIVWSGVGVVLSVRASSKGKIDGVSIVVGI